MGLKLCKFNQWLRAWWTELLLSLRGIFSAFGFFGIIASIIAIQVLSRIGASNDLIFDTAHVQYANIISSILIFSFWLILNVFVSMWRAGVRLSEQGQWFGSVFVYHQPVTICAFHVTSDQTPFRNTFKFNGVPAGALVRFCVEAAADVHYYNATVYPEEGIRFDFGSCRIGRFNSSVISKNKRFEFEANATRPDAAPITFRVIVDSWTYQPSK